MQNEHRAYPNTGHNDEKKPSPLLYDASGNPIETGKSVPVIHEAPQKRTVKVDALIPHLATVKKQFDSLGIVVDQSDVGGLGIAVKRPKKIEIVATGTVPKEFHDNERKTEEYYEFPPKLIASVMEAHKDGMINLHSADKKQFAIYIAKIMHACGFSADSDAYRVIGACVGENKDTAQPLKDLVYSRLPKHPHADEVSKTKGGLTWKIKKYDVGDVPYDHLALALMPKIWDSMDSIQKKKLIKSFLLLHEIITNFKEIDAARLHERLSEICINEKDVSLRYNIYALIDTVPYESLTTTTKNNLARAIIQHNEFSTDIAFSLLTESKGIAKKNDHRRKEFSNLEKLWPVYQEYEDKVLESISAPLEDLAGTNAMEWTKLLDSVTRLSPYALINPQRLRDNESNIGLEFEFAPLLGQVDDIVVKFKDVLDRLDPAFTHLSTDRDQDCAEVRTGARGEPFDVTILQELHQIFQTLHHVEPMGWWATMHLHVDDDKYRSKRIQHVYRECIPNEEHRTYEVRSLPSPNMYIDGATQGQELHRMSIARLAHLIRCAIGSNEIPADTNKQALKLVNYDSLDNDARVRKLLALSLCGTDPGQRAAVLYSVYTSPMFLSPAFLLEVTEGIGSVEDEINLLKAGINIVPKEARREYLKKVATAGQFGMTVLQELYTEASDEKYQEEIIEIICRGNVTTVLPFLINNYHSVQNDVLRRLIIIKVINNGGYPGMDILKKWYTEANEFGLKKIIVGAVAMHANNDGVAKLMEWYHESHDVSIRENIIFEIANHRGEEVLPFLIEQYPKINDPPTKDSIIHAVTKHGGENGMVFVGKCYQESTDSHLRKGIIWRIARNSKEAGLPFLIRHYDEIKEDHNLRNAIATAVAKHGDESGMTTLQEWYDQSGDDLPYKKHILYTVGKHSGKVGWPLVIRNFPEVNDYDLRDSLIAWIVNSHGGEVRTFALKEIYLSVNDDSIRNEIVECIIRNGREFGITVMEELYKMEHDQKKKEHILRRVSLRTDSKVGIKFLIRHFPEVEDYGLLSIIEEEVNSRGDKEDINALASLK